MTAVTEDAGPVPESATADDTGPAPGGDPDSGLTDADLTVIAEAAAAVFRVCSRAASRVLALQRPGAEEAVTGAETELAEARAALEAPQAVVDRLNAELAECRRRGEEVRLAGDDESLAVRLEARSLRAAVAEETAALEERLRTAVRAAVAPTVAVAAAERKARAARSTLAALNQAIQTPFFTGLGMATKAHERWLLATGAWYGSGSPEAEGIVIRHLRATGLGDRLQRDAIRAFTSGDPVAVAAGGNVKRWQDGTELTYTPGGPAVVRNTHMSAESMGAVPPAPQAPAPGAAEVMAGIRAGTGWPAPAPQAVTKAAEPLDSLPALRRLMNWAAR